MSELPLLGLRIAGYACCRQKNRPTIPTLSTSLKSMLASEIYTNEGVKQWTEQYILDWEASSKRHGA
jgi:hypothetical protein